MKDILTPSKIIDYIESLPRVGCKAFKYISHAIILEYNYFILEKMSLNTFNLDQVLNYNGNSANRINKKIINVSERYKYYKEYNANTILDKPLVTTNNYELIDGFHRLAYFRDNSILEFYLYRGIK